MFDHRLGLALGMDLRAVRGMPYRDWYAWRLYDLLEPFGWQNDEYHFASLMAMLYNVNRGKKGKARDAKDFMREMLPAILKELEEKPDLSTLTREQIVAMIKKDLGIR